MKTFFGKNGHGARIVATVLFAASLVVNGLAGTRFLGGNTTAEVSNSYANLFAPAGVTFAIWGVIYLLVAVYCVRQFRTIGTTEVKTDDPMFGTITQYFAVVTVLNMVWLLAWQYRVLWLSVLLIVAMLVVLAKISSATFNRKLSVADWATIKLPFSIYFGWVTVATIANSTTFLVSLGWNGWGVSAELWTAALLLVGAVIGVITALRRQDWAYMAVFVWAYFGIWLQHTSATGHDGNFPLVIGIAMALLMVLSAATVWVWHKWPLGSERT